MVIIVIHVVCGASVSADEIGAFRMSVSTLLHIDSGLNRIVIKGQVKAGPNHCKLPLSRCADDVRFLPAPLTRSM
jgi:hypothetical protein